MPTTAPTEAPERQLARDTLRLLLVIIVLGAALRFYGLARYSVWYDEGSSLYIASLASDPARLVDPEWSTEPPLTPILAQFWLGAMRSAFGLESGSYAADVLLRLLPAILSLTAVPLVFFVARRLTGSPGSALLAAFLVAISPFHIYYAQELRPYAAFVPLALGALLFTLRALERDRIVDWIGMVALLSLSMYNHFITVWTIISINAAFLLYLQERMRLLWKWMFAQALVIVLSLPAIRLGLLINDMTSQMKTSWYPPLTWVTPFVTFKDFFAGYSPNEPAYFGLYAIAVAGLILGIVAMRRRVDPLGVILAMAIIPILGNYFVWQAREFSYYQHRLFIFCGVMFAIVIAHGIATIRPMMLRRGMILAFALLTLPCLLDLYAQRLHPSMAHRLGTRYKVDNRSAADYIRHDLRDGDVIAHYCHFTFTPFYYHYLSNSNQFTIGFTEDDRKGLIASFPVPKIWEHIGCLPERVETLTENAKRVWYVESWWEPFDVPFSARLYRDWLDYHAVRVDRRYFDGVTVYLYDVQEMRERHPRMERLADFGDVTEVRYLQQDTGSQEYDAILAAQSLLTLMPEQERVGVTLVHLDDGSFAQIRNEMDSAKTFQAFSMPSAETIPALAFTRNDPESDRWFFVHHGNPDFVHPLARVAIASHARAGSLKDRGIYADVILAAGEYTVAAFVWQEVAPENRSRAILDFRVQPIDTGHTTIRPEFVGRLIPHATEGEQGWRWYVVGSIATVEEPFRLAIQSNNDHRLPDAYVDLAYVSFVPKSNTTGTRQLGPITEQAVVVDARGLAELPLEKFGNRLDLILYNPEIDAQRLLTTYATP